MAGARIRAIPLTYLGTLVIGMVLGVLIAEFGDLFWRFPVESVLVVVLVCSVVVLGWACREMLLDLVRRARGSAEPEEPASGAEPKLVPHRAAEILKPNGVRR
jgi:MFS family permease